jgi:hypothetical protein
MGESLSPSFSKDRLTAMANKQPSICPAGGTCFNSQACAVNGKCCRWVGATPIEILFPHDPRPATHFVGFRDGDRFHNAVRVFGRPDFVHFVWDQRAQREVADYDTVVFAKYDDKPPSPYNYDDSNQAGDPAAQERLG